MRGFPWSGRTAQGSSSVAGDGGEEVASVE
jgi:hypothetical protein